MEYFIKLKNIADLMKLQFVVCDLHLNLKKSLDLVQHTSSSPVLVVTTSMSELLSSSVTVSNSSVGVADLNWKGVLAPRMSPACVT